MGQECRHRMKLDELQKNLGYTFKDPALLKLAVTHPSKGHELKTRLKDNQRLEFLGDAVLQMILTDKLYTDLKKLDEGELTHIRAGMVNSQALEALAQQFDLGDFLILGRGEMKNQGRTKRSNLADAMEAVIGAVYLDAGFDAVKIWLGAILDPLIQQGLLKKNEFNPKGKLQEMLQGKGIPTPDYQLLSESGPDHQKEYEVAVVSEGKEIGRGSGSSKKAAEMQAAADALKLGK